MSTMIESATNLSAWAWRLSLETALPIILLLALARLRWLPVRWSVWISVIVLVRLLLPAVPAVTWRPALLSPAPVIAPSVPETVMATETANLFTAEDVATNSVTDLSAFALAALPVVWALGFAGIVIWLAGSHWMILRWTRGAHAPDAWLTLLWSRCREEAGCQLQVPLLLVPGLSTVAVHGLFRPRLLAPVDLGTRYSEEEIRSMFLHELAHIRRHDVLWASLGLIACALHWFNPLAWLALRRFTNDREILCDDFALSIIGQSSRQQYGGTLLKLLEENPPSSPVSVAPFFRNQTELKHRLMNIMKPTPSNLWSRLLALIAVPAIATLTLTTSLADEEKAKPRAEGESEIRKAVTRDGEREGEKRGPRDGEVRKEGARDGDQERRGPRDGEMKKEGARDGEREGERGPRDGEARKEGARDGDREGEKRGARDGEMKKEGAEREGDMKKPSREGDGDRPKKEGEREGGETMKKPLNKEPASAGEMKKPGVEKNPGAVVVSLDADGNVVSTDGWVVPADTVRAKLQALAQKNPDQSITLRANSATPLDKVMAVMQTMKEAGIKNVTLGNVK